MASDGNGTGDAIATYLRVQRISQRELGRRLGWSHTKVQNHLASDQRISIADLELICAALDVPMSTFLPASEVTAS
jgi:transcriptional regulator with XRE-family HTH domain